MKKLRIVLAEDHAIVREGLLVLINCEADMRVVGESGTGRETIELARRLQPDLIVMDLTMPELNGLQATEIIKTELPETQIVVLTMHEDPASLSQALRVGASGYVLKRSPLEELLQALRVVAAGGVSYDPTLLGRVLVKDRRKPAAAVQLSLGELSEREEQVLRAIAWGYTYKEIADLLQVSTKTVETHKLRVEAKLKLSGRAGMVRYALRRGWLTETQQPLAGLVVALPPATGQGRSISDAA